MIATIVNVAAVLVGGGIGLLFKNKISQRFVDLLFLALALCTSVIGISGALGTEDVLGMIVCMVVGAAVGEALQIEAGLEKLGDGLKRKLVRKDSPGNGTFTEAFVTASLLYCVGSMAIMGSLDAGISQNYTILFSKSLLDAVAGITYAATLGYGVLFAALPVLVYQGLITLLATWVAPVLSPAVIREMSAVGGVLIMALSINMLGLRQKKIPLGNLLPCMLLPIAYQPLAAWIKTLL